ncbi:DUF4129 domain-containing protein [Aquibacillus rhizosphaerae]|uniref:DUF4129 domain-containing protein n=1 Tax=Aquibacillus rhizosphaerae TaxID=3051431 RepID=A0ABT7L4A3_9BACI|nr:DUF4129 domain-containing protein [Aquibacillus sp. LR5S19]MDL4840698.1 DUF4129 domain-containing protein [Aquibacillus sp. LR5S19]
MKKDEEARDQLRNILDEKEYTVYYQDNRSFIEVWWDKGKAWILDMLEKLFSSFQPSDTATNGVLIGIIIVTIALIALTIYFSVRTYRRKRIFQDKKPLQFMDEIHWSYHKHLEEANKREELLAYKEAIRHMFLAVLLFLHEKSQLEARIWKTNWEYYDELKKVSQKQADLFFKLAILFDEVTYGERQVNQEEYLRFKQETMKWFNKDEAENVLHSDEKEE